MKHLYLILVALLFSFASFAVGPIGGITSMCIGTGAAYTNSTPGGTWSSSTPSVGTINATTGSFTSISTGVTTITYSDGSSMATLVVTVHPLPLPITGPTDVCDGSAITLSSATAGGTWSAPGYSAIATIGSATGVVTGVAAGVAVISYTSSLGCRITRTVTVLAAPASISGAATVCVGSISTLSGTPVGGMWSTVSVTATINSTSGDVTGLSAGTTDITYTLATGCYITRTITVNPCASLGFATVDHGNNISIYPNPANEELHIEHITPNTAYTLYNVVGAVVQEGILPKTNNTIALRSLPPGMYLLQLTDEQGGRVVRKVVRE